MNAEQRAKQPPSPARAGAGKLVRCLASHAPGRRRGLARWIGLALCALTVAQARSEDTEASKLADLSLEDLMKESVTSVSKKETKLAEAPAAIAVITQEDLRRSGFTTIPEALRMVPGLQVARVNAHQWAISSRGFNSAYANKLLVLVDGRSVYTPAFAGVYWDVQDLMMEDVDRIEIIRGPGATLWGANAVNGVINITTRTARQTQGMLVSTAVGTEEQPIVGVRYGGQAATNLYYRAYVKYFNRDGLALADGKEAPSDWNSFRTGLRLDWEPTTIDLLTLQGDYYNGFAEEKIEVPIPAPPYAVPMLPTHHNTGGNALARWTRTLSDHSSLTAQTYYDRYTHGDGVNLETRDTFDLDLQHRFAAGSRHDLVWGMGYRHTADFLPPSATLTFVPERRQDDLYSAFVQDEIALVRERLRLTLGTKLEHNDYTGVEVQPNARLLWSVTDKQTLWTSASRAVRTPSRFEENGRLRLSAFPTGPAPTDPAGLSTFVPNHNIASEILYAYELGYRLQPLSRLSLDVAAFYNSYEEVVSFTPQTPSLELTPAPPHLLVPLQTDNGLSGETYGVELSARWNVTDQWQLAASYTRLEMHLWPNLEGYSAPGENPKNQFQVRSYLALTEQLELNAAVYFVDGLPTQGIASYLRADLGLIWRPSPQWELGVWGQNLTEHRHQEFEIYKTTDHTYVPRSVLGKVTWRF